MRVITISRVLGMLLGINSLTFLLPGAVALVYDDELLPFLLTTLVTLVAGVMLYLPTARHEFQPRIKEGFVIVVLYWLVLGFVGTLPFLLSPALQGVPFVHCLFESFSGLTTTGATVFSNLDNLPRSILFYRQQLQWLGGMGIIVLALAVLPTLGFGGQILFNAEIASPIKNHKLSPRISQTAKSLWGVYAALTALCALLYHLAGMSWFDAIAHSFSTISIGGFSTHDANLGYFDSTAVESVAMMFMIIASINFALHFNLWHRRDLDSFRDYLRDTETRTFLYIIAIVCVVSVLLLQLKMTLDWPRAIRQGVFHAVSIASTTGFTTADWHSWPSGIPYLLIFASFIGACAGSTGGGIKVIRLLLLIKQGAREIIMQIHPRSIQPLRLGGRVIPERTVNTIWGFFALYFSAFFSLFILLLLVGLQPVTAFSALASCLNNLGPAMGDAAANYATLNEAAKYILSFAMLLGRLEFYTLVVILTPAFWRA